MYEEGKTNEPAIDTIILKGNETKQFKEVPKVTQDNKEIKYVVKEIKVTKGGANFTYEQVGNAELNGNNVFELVNKPSDNNIPKVQYGAHKTWQYVNENELNSYEVEVGLYEEGKTNEPAIDTIILKGNETKQFKEVPKVTQDNKEIKYVVKEIKVTKGGANFTYEQVGNAELNGNNVFELVNKPSDNNIPKVQYGAHKTWQYVNENELNSYEVEVGLYEEGKTNEPAIDTIILKGNETKQFKEVPKVTQDNKEIKYVVKEIKVTKGGANFTYEQVGNAELNGNNVFELVNKPSDNNIPKVQYGAHKTWQYVNENELNSYEVEVGLYEEGKTNEPAIDTIILKGNETKQFKEVPKVTQDNKEIKYVVKEIKVTKGGANFTYEQVGNAELNGNNVFELVNKPSDNNIPKVQYGAHKTWQYVNENELNSYEVEVGLYEEGKTNEPAIDTIILKGNETKQFKEVPKVTQDNKEIKYVVKEIKVTKGGADFTYEQVGNAELNGNNVFELVNKPSDNNIPKVQYGAHKTWQYVNENELNSYEVEVGLYEEGKTNEPAIDTIILKGNETKQFKEVPKVTQDNKEIKYVVKEIKVTKDGADFAYEQVGNAELNGNNVFELVNKPQEQNIGKLTIKVTKEWVGVEDPANLTATINLLENEDPTDNKVVTGNNSVIFTADKFDSDGNPLTLDQIKEKYTISETNIPEGYKLDSVSEPSMDENGVVNYTVKNIVDGTVYRTLVAEKQWLNRDASPMSDEDAAKYQVKITVSKLVNGNITPLSDEEVKGDLTITGNGKIEFKVPARDDQGNFIKYYLSEKVTDTDDGQVSYIQRTEDIKDPENKNQIQGLYGVKFINQLQDLTIKKLDGSNNNQPLQGIEFTIVKDNYMISGTTNSDGVLVGEGIVDGKISLSEGDYVVSETNAENMGYKATTPVILRVTTDSILIVNKDENGNEIGTTLLPNGVLKITNYVIGSENDPKVEPEDKQDDPTPVPDPNQPGGSPDSPGGQQDPNPQGGDSPGGNNQDDSSGGGNSGGGDSGDRDRDNEPRRPRTTSDTVTVNDDATPLSVPDTGNNGDADTVTVDEETTPLSAANTNGDELEIAEDEVPLSLPKTGSQDNMLYVILGMAMAIFGIKKFRK
ncbi:Cna B-type domain-containing protein [Peptostreptococcaceae bacterium oral taxon 081]|nr:Cna B-type domain-containing protein [Peptostreptococcaceae bacterium oral taxon 081]